MSAWCWRSAMALTHERVRERFCESFARLAAARRCAAAVKEHEARRHVQDTVLFLLAMLDCEQECLQLLPFGSDRSPFASRDLRWGAERTLELLADKPLDAISEYFCLLHSELLVALHAKERDGSPEGEGGPSEAGRSALHAIYAQLAEAALDGEDLEG